MAAPNFVQYRYGRETATAGVDVTLSFSAAPTSGNLLTLAAICSSGTTLTTPTGWTLAFGPVTCWSGAKKAYGFYRTSEGSASVTGLQVVAGGGIVWGLMEHDLVFPILNGAAVTNAEEPAPGFATGPTTSYSAGRQVVVGYCFAEDGPQQPGDQPEVEAPGTLRNTYAGGGWDNATEEIYLSDRLLDASAGSTSWRYLFTGTGDTLSVGFSFSEGSAPLVDCDSPIAFDVYSLGTATTPALTYLATLCDAFDKSFRVELDGTGSGKFSINRSSADATEAILGDGDGAVRYVKVRIPDIDADPIFGFFIEEGDFRLLDSDEDGGETLTFQGHGSLSYLGFATMLAHSYITGGMDPYTGLWRLYQAGTGSKPGQILARLIEEAQDTDRPQKPLPLLTDTFDYTNDSNAAAWASSTATNEFAASIGETVLSVVGRLIGTGAITVQMSPDLVLSAYNSFGTDRSNATFAANKVRFVGGTNIATGLTRQLRPTRVATHALVYGESEASAIASLADAASRVTREVFLSSTGTDTTALDAVGDADLAERQLRSESLAVRIALGSDDSTGLYLPGPSGSTAGKFWVGDTVTLHTGTGEFDYNNASFRVAAINFVEGSGVAAVTDLEVVVELGSTGIGEFSDGSTGILSSSPGGGSSAVPAHFHPSSTVISPWKEPVRAASTANLTIASPGASIDGVTMAAQDRFLAKDQSTGSQNGIYVWLGAATAAVRAPDFASGTSALGAVVYATEGTVNADRAFVCTTNETITLGTTSLSFVPTALLPHGGGEETVYPHGNMGATETFDPANGNWHTGTFDTNCTFTLTAPRSGKGCTIFLELAQDGTGGRTMTLPASVTNRAELEAAQVTTASTTAFLILWTRDGGTTWYGAWGGASSPLTTKGDLWGYSTTDARLPVGTNSQAVVADSTQTLGVRYGDVVGPLLISSTHSTPLVFDDLLQNSDGDDLLYAAP